MTTDLGFFTLAASETDKDDHMDDKMDQKDQMENVMSPRDADEVAHQVEVEAPQKQQKIIPNDYDLNNTLDIFSEFLSNDADHLNAQALDAKKYLEMILSPNLENKNVEFHIIISIIIMVNYQLSIGKKCSVLMDLKFSKLFSKALIAFNDESSNLIIKSEIMVFIGNCFANLDLNYVKPEALRLVGIGTLCSIDDNSRKLYFDEIPELESVWEKTVMNINSIKKESTRDRVEFERRFMFSTLKFVLESMDLSMQDQQIDDDLLLMVESFLDLSLKIITQIPSRRFFNLILKDSFFFLRAKDSILVQRLQKLLEKTPHIRLLQQLDLLEFYSYFGIDESTGSALSKADMLRMHYDRIRQLQKFCFQNLKDQTEDFALSNVGAVDNFESLTRILSEIPQPALLDMCNQLGVRATDLNGNEVDKDFMVKSLIFYLKKREMDRIEWMRNDVLYPDEKIVFDETVSRLTRHPIALTSLSLRYLTLTDYIYRQYRLLKFEYSYRIREDVLDVCQRLAPVKNRHNKSSSSIQFQGAARMAVPIEKIDIVEKGNTMIGNIAPSYVRAHIVFSLSNLDQRIANEWDLLASDDILYLLAFDANDIKHESDDKLYKDTNQKFGLKYIRSARIVGWIGSNGQIVKDGIYNTTLSADRSTGALSSSRTLLVELDPLQFVHDQNRRKKRSNAVEFYDSFNVIMRRKASDNAWSYLLQPLREIVGYENLVPEWLKGVFLGHEDASNANYRYITEGSMTMNFRDTFLDIEHIKESFPNMEVHVEPKKFEPPFVLQFPKKFWELEGKEEILEEKAKKRRTDSRKYSGKESLEVKGAVAKFCPYEDGSQLKNTFRYSPNQIEAILSGMLPALTLIKSPPGTTGTRVAAQITSNLYNNGHNHRILLVARSDLTLDKFLDSLSSKNIDERHVLRLGHPVDRWNPRHQYWGRAGRVDAYLSKRISLLEKVSRLAKSLQIDQDYGATCELAGYFFESNVRPLWDEFISKTEGKSGQELKVLFPFMDFFADRTQPLFKDDMSFTEALHVAEGCYEFIKSIFTDLAELRPFEILRDGEDRADYLIMKGVRIVAVTSSYASIHREKLLNLGFRFESLIIMDAAQILDSESFFCFLLQSLHEETGLSRLERLVLVGDDGLLLPKVSNPALSRKCNLSQSLFSRLTRLGFPVIELDEQSEYRPTIADIFRPCYSNLKDSSIILETEAFGFANPGFCFEYQFINVEDYFGKGEIEPRERFIQNLGEAEYAVAIFMYMRLIGYPNDSITILTATHGQKELIKDIISQRCGWNKYFGTPSALATIDEYQEQKNSYVILSLVRTSKLGNLTDGRRLLSAFSRATTGLYVLGRKNIFEEADVFQNSFNSFWKYPSNHLWLTKDELFGNNTRSVDTHGLKFVAKSSKWQTNKKDQEKFKEVHGVEEMGALVHALSQDKLKASTEISGKVVQSNPNPDLSVPSHELEVTYKSRSRTASSRGQSGRTSPIVRLNIKSNNIFGLESIVCQKDKMRMKLSREMSITHWNISKGVTFLVNPHWNCFGEQKALFLYTESYKMISPVEYIFKCAIRLPHDVIEEYEVSISTLHNPLNKFHHPNFKQPLISESNETDKPQLFDYDLSGKSWNVMVSDGLPIPSVSATVHCLSCQISGTAALYSNLKGSNIVNKVGAIFKTGIRSSFNAKLKMVVEFLESTPILKWKHPLLKLNLFPISIPGIFSFEMGIRLDTSLSLSMVGKGNISIDFSLIQSSALTDMKLENDNSTVQNIPKPNARIRMSNSYRDIWAIGMATITPSIGISFGLFDHPIESIAGFHYDAGISSGIDFMPHLFTDNSTEIFSECPYGSYKYLKEYFLRAVANIGHFEHYTWAPKNYTLETRCIHPRFFNHSIFIE